jgi:hypothetical protein
MKRSDCIYFQVRPFRKSRRCIAVRIFRQKRDFWEFQKSQNGQLFDRRFAMKGLAAYTTTFGSNVVEDNNPNIVADMTFCVEKPYFLDNGVIEHEAVHAALYLLRRDGRRQKTLKGIGNVKGCHNEEPLALTVESICISFRRALNYKLIKKTLKTWKRSNTLQIF